MRDEKTERRGFSRRRIECPVGTWELEGSESDMDRCVVRDLGISDKVGLICERKESGCDIYTIKVFGPGIEGSVILKPCVRERGIVG